MYNIEAEQLVSLWVQHSVGAKEDFDIMVVDFLETLHENIPIYEVLAVAKSKAQERVKDHTDDVALMLSHKAFNRSLEYQLQFWEKQ